jgi:hypothetical protein
MRVVAELISPTVRLRTSFLAAIAEFRADRDLRPPWLVTDVDPQGADRRGRLRCLRCASAEQVGAISGLAGLVRAQ